MPSVERTAAKPSGVVALHRLALGELGQPVLEMHGAVFGVGRVPGQGLQALGADHGIGQIGAVHQIVAEAFVGVGDPNHVVLGRAFGFHGNLTLHLLVA